MLKAFTALAATLFAGMAFAADMPIVPKAAYFVPAPVREWTGFYLGANGGWATGTSSVSSAVSSIQSDEFTLQGALIGGTVGFNIQAGPMVWGVEGDLAWSGIRGEGACFAAAFNCKVRTSWLSTARARLGYAYGNWLPYITAGMAMASVQLSSSLPGEQATAHGGWTVGAGLETAFARNWSVKAEYLFLELDPFHCDANTCLPLARAQAPFREHLLRLGVNYQFN